MRHLSHDLLDYNISLFKHHDHTKEKEKSICISLLSIFWHLKEDFEGGELTFDFYFKKVQKIKDCIVVNGLMENKFIKAEEIIKEYNRLQELQHQKIA